MLRFDKLTLKAQEAVQAAQEIAAERGHQQIEPLHLPAVLAAQQDDIVVFNPLGREHLERIVEIQLGRVRELLAARILEGTVLPGEHLVADADAASGQICLEHTTVEAGAASNSV